MKKQYNIRPFNIQFFGGERTEAATPRRRGKAREEGQMTKSQDRTAAVVIISGLLSVYILALLSWNDLIFMFRGAMEHIASPQLRGDGWITRPLNLGSHAFALAWLPVGLLCAFAAIFIISREAGFKIVSKPFIPNFNKFNPVSGLKKIISMRSLVELLKGVAKASLLLGMLYSTVQKEQGFFMSVLMHPLGEGAILMMGKLWWVAMRMALMLLLIGFIDYAYQKWSFEKSIRMSKQDIKDEYKQMEGDPQVKRRIKQKQRELARSRMMSDVPKADVVVTNPTHIAVALQYDPHSMAAPIVVAKGQALIAEKIKKIANENKIPIIENKPLARGLFEQVEVGESVPQQLYKAVAEVLAFIYRLKNKKQKVKATSGTP
ncbi:flagellar biosynthesis protein FlhB [Synergistales bacterium]|nr:flagellar biosynthesis protein FlhB [Synergistales bacterium]